MGIVNIIGFILVGHDIALGKYKIAALLLLMHIYIYITNYKIIKNS